MAAKVDLNVDQGASFVYSINLKDNSGGPLDLTGYTGNAQLRTSYSSNNYTTMNVSITAATGLIQLTMNSYVTSTLTRTRYLYDVELYYSNNTTRLMEGFVNVSPNVTR